MIKYLVPIILVISILISGCTQNNNATTNDTTVTTSTCDVNLWNHVYNPARLHVVDQCKIVSGTIEYIRKEADGDDHIRIKLDPQYSSLINQANINDQYGDLVIESICTNSVTQKDAIASCKGFHQSFNISIGEHIKIKGAYVLDSEHGWMEIHPITSIDLR